MEQLVKQNQTLNPRNALVNTGANQKYRALIVKLLAQLQDASIELIEGDKHQNTG